MQACAPSSRSFASAWSIVIPPSISNTNRETALTFSFLRRAGLNVAGDQSGPSLFARIAGFDRRLIIWVQGSETSRGVVSIFPVNVE
jgi:proteasome lid subunit RPN8/RPN11